MSRTLFLILLCACFSEAAERCPTNFGLSVLPDAATGGSNDKLKFVGQTPEQAALAAYQKAEALFRDRKLDQSLAAIEEALKLNDTLVAYARLLFTLGRFDESEKLIDRALAAERDSRDVQYEKGRLRLERGDYAEAIKYGKKALELPGVGATERQIHYMLARAYVRAGRKELAEFHLAKFRAAPPTLRR